MKRKIGTLRLQKETLRSLTGVALTHGPENPMLTARCTAQSCTQICPAPVLA
jgi:hypothetical protein